MADHQGLKAALGSITAAELAELQRAARDGQMSLLPMTPGEADFDPEAPATGAEEGRRGPGRPKGALNKSTQWWRDYMIGRFGSPLVALAQIYSRPLGVLMREVGCSGLEAIKLQIVAAKELAPYVHQKLPVQVDLGDRGLVNLVINVASERTSGRQSGEGFTIDIEPVQVEIDNATKSEG